MDKLTPQIISWLLLYRYYILFPIAVAEGPIITVFAGFLVSTGHFNFIVAYLVIVVADVIGDMLYYAVGRWGGRRGIRKWGHYFGVHDGRLPRLEEHFKKHPFKTLLSGKLAHGLGGIVLMVAGLAKMPFGQFLLYSLVLTVPKSLILLTLGYYFGSAYGQVSSWLDVISISVLVIALVLLLIYYIIPAVIRTYCKLKDLNGDL